MKQTISTIILIMHCFTISAQEAQVITDKQKYKFDEIIECTFELNAKFDSLDLPQLNGFKIIDGPSKGSVTSVQNGITTITETRTYSLRPTQSGRLKINTATYYIDGAAIEGEPVWIEVLASNLTEAELAEKRALEFIEDGIKPTGTIRIVFHDPHGYVETFGEWGWQFHRRLTADEIAVLKAMK